MPPGAIVKYPRLETAHPADQARFKGTTRKVES
jgi:hypothetical protein